MAVNQFQLFRFLSTFQNIRPLVLLILAFALLTPIAWGEDAPASLGKGVTPETWPTTVESFKGKYTFVVFWEVTCEPCIEEMPGLIEVFNELAPSGLVMCEVNVDPPARYDQAARLLDQLKIPFQRFYKAPSSDVRFRQVVDEEYGANPFAILFNPEGKKEKTFAEAKTKDEWLEVLRPYVQQKSQTPSLQTESLPKGSPATPAAVQDEQASLLDNPLSLLDLPDLSNPNPPDHVSAAPLPAGSAKSGKTPFRVDAPQWKSTNRTKGQIAVPFACSQEAHLILSTLQIEKIKGRDLIAGAADVSKRESYYMDIRDETEEILRTPGSILLPISWDESGSAPDRPFEIRLTCQGCTDGLKGACYPPESFLVSGSLVQASGELRANNLMVKWMDPMSPQLEPEDAATSIIPLVHATAGAAPPSADSGIGSEEQSGVFGANGLQDTTLVERAVKKSLLLVFFLAFLGGILTSFTPCVYPMIPATVAIFGAKEVKSKIMACSLAATYIMGVALSYASLGVLAAAVGTVFGAMMENPWLISIVAAFYVILGLSMLDIFTFYLPSSWVSAASQVNRKGYLGAFLMGLVSSIVFAPCGEPILLGILTWVAKTQSFFLGFWLLFVYAWGIGVLFFVIATFSSSIQYLPKAGAWMVAVKDFFGLLLFGLAIYWMHFVLSPGWLWGLATAYCLGVATFVHTRNHGFEGWSRGVLSFVTLAAILAGSIPLQKFAIHHGWLPGGNGNQVVSVTAGNLPASSEDEGIQWRRSSPITDLAHAQDLGKPVIVDYRTNVCPKCDEIEHEVFNDPKVQEALEGYVTIQVNLSDIGRNAEIREIQHRQGVFAVPVIEFYDSKGNYLKHKRIADVLTAEEFLRHIRDIG